ncbi:MAG: hypothetical protein J6B29_00095 [Clostridia bacterium]|nr:hypothetical protein [Clostridia bacterium]
MADVVSKIKGKAKKAVGSAKKYAGVAKLKLSIKMEEASLEESFENLGRAYYVHMKSGEDNSVKLVELIMEIDASVGKIREMKAKIADIEGKDVCEHCDSAKDHGSPCEKCGEKIVAERAEEKTDNNDEEIGDDTKDLTGDEE